MKTNSLKVPKSTQAVYDEITAISDDFCRGYPDKEYVKMARKLAATPAGIIDGTIAW
jgi:hypothetical protein